MDDDGSDEWTRDGVGGREHQGAYRGADGGQHHWPRGRAGGGQQHRPGAASGMTEVECEEEGKCKGCKRKSGKNPAPVTRVPPRMAGEKRRQMSTGAEFHQLRGTFNVFRQVGRFWCWGWACKAYEAGEWSNRCRECCVNPLQWFFVFDLHPKVTWSRRKVLHEW